MRTLNEIKQEIDSLSDRRIEVMRALSQGFDATLKAEHKSSRSRSRNSGKSSATRAPCCASAIVT